MTTVDLEAIRRQEARWQILSALDAGRPELMGAEIVQRYLIRKGLGITAAELRKEVGYLVEKGLVTIGQGNGLRLSAHGVDVVEQSVESPPGITPPLEASLNLEYGRRQEMRWRILRAVDAGRPNSVSEHIVWRALDDLGLLVTTAEFRREVLYLLDRNLLAIQGQESWRLDLTAHGVDLVEYSIDAIPGVARPERYW